MLQRPQLAFRWRILKGLKIDLNSFFLGLLPEGQDIHHTAGLGEWPVGQSDGYLTGVGSIRVIGKAPLEVCTPGDGGNSLAVEFGEVEVALGDSADAFHLGGRLACDTKRGGGYWKYVRWV